MSIFTYTTKLTSHGAEVAPPTFKGGVHLGEGFLDGERTTKVLINSQAAETNLMELALLERREEIGLPSICIGNHDLLELPHLLGSAILRDAKLDGEPFGGTEIGQAIYASPYEDATAIFTHCPFALIFGYWLSFRADKSQAHKVRRCVTSKIIGYDVAKQSREGVARDILGIEHEAVVYLHEDPEIDWTLDPETEDGKQRKLYPSEEGAGRPSIIGHGGILCKEATYYECREIRKVTTISPVPLRKLRFEGSRNHHAEAVLSALARLAVAAAQENGYDLRSGCVLDVVESDIPRYKDALADWEKAVKKCDIPFSPEDIVLDAGRTRELVARVQEQVRQTDLRDRQPT